MGYNLYLVSLFIALPVALSLAVFLWRRRAAPGAKAAAALMAGVSLALNGYILEERATTLAARQLCLDLEYIGIVGGPLMLFIYASQVARYEGWLKHHIYLLAIMPVLAMLLVWTNDLHGLMWYNARLELHNDVLVMIKTYGWGFKVHAVYSYGLIFFTIGLLTKRLTQYRRIFRKQYIIFLLSISIPLAWNIIYVLRAAPTYHLDMTPAAFTLSGILLTFGLYRYKIFNVIPIARGSVIDVMSDGFIVLDTQNRIVDSNPAAQGILGFQDSQLIGNPVKDIIKDDAFLKHLKYGQPSRLELVLTINNFQKYFELHVIPLYNKYQNLNGRLVMMHDLTEQKKAEQELRAYSRKLIEVQEEERRIIARDLHDDIGQTLTVLKLLLASAKRSPDKADIPLTEAEGAVDELVGKIRQIARDLRPTMIDDLGLCHALTWLFGQYKLRTHIQVNFGCDNMDKDIPPDIKLAAYRIIQEALTNVARYAEVGEVWVNVQISGKELTIYIEDKGKGFDPAAVNSTSTGLSGMRERAQALAGSFSLESASGKGTRIRASLPLD